MPNFATFKSHLKKPLAVVEMLLYRHGVWLVLLGALIYYAQYYRCGLNLSGEGGTTAMIAMRMMEGQKPISEIFLGYNVMWFYPVVWLFELFGPSYFILRIYFFVLCALTAAMVFLVVRKVSGSGWYAVLASVIPLVMPGMIFRNYMGFLAMLNMLCLLQAFVFEQGTRARQWLWMAAAGFSVGLTYLVRIELGIFFTVISLGLIVLYPLCRRREFPRRIGDALVGLVLLILFFFATHAPVYFHAQQRGFGSAFGEQYLNSFGLLRSHAKKEIGAPSPAPTSSTASEKPAPTPEKEYLPRPSDEASVSDSDRLLMLGIYLPIPIVFLIVLSASLMLLVALWRDNFTLRTKALVLLITTGSALTLFAQYFFFRPDPPHLVEFMIPFGTALACAIWLAAVGMRKIHLPLLRILLGLFIVFCVADIGVYLVGNVNRESTGTIAVRRKRSFEFVADNGVRVLLKKGERQEYQTLYDTITKYADKDDYVVCYPYAPTLNLMTNRRSYEYNLYVDDVHHDRNFHGNTVREMETYKPAVIVIEDRDINKTEASRFSNWAAPTYAYIRENYRHAGTWRRQEIYIRPDLYDQQEQTLPKP